MLLHVKKVKSLASTPVLLKIKLSPLFFKLNKYKEFINVVD